MATPTTRPCAHGLPGSLVVHPSTADQCLPSSSVLAATIPAPNEPVRVAEIRAPDARARRGAAPRVVLRGVRHGRAPPSRQAVRRSVPAHSGPRVGRVDRRACAARWRTSKAMPFHEGDVVTFLDVHETCGACYHCLVTKQTTRCPHRKVYGITYGVKDGLMGGWSQALYAAARREAHSSAEDARSRDVHRWRLRARDVASRRRSRGHSARSVRRGARCRVRSGQSAIALSALSGAGEVIAVGDPASRLEFAKRMGATATFGLDMPAGRAHGRDPPPNGWSWRRRGDRGVGEPGGREPGVGPRARRRPRRDLRSLHRQRARSRSIRTGRSIASTSRFAAAGAATIRTFTARSRSRRGSAIGFRGGR